MEIIKNIKNINLDNAKKLYKEAFNDSDEFIDLYFGQYEKYNDYYFMVDNNEIIFMACANKKRIMLNNKKEEACFIVAIATKKEHQKKGIMKSFFQKWLDELSFFYKSIFIQAYNWNVYKSYDFKTCTLKKMWTLRHDQYLKPSDFFDNVDYDRILEITNDFIKINKIKNFSYKTSKENQLYYKMLLKAGDKIYMNKHAYIVVGENNIVFDYGFNDLKEFIKLLSNFKDNPLKIKSYIDLDKRFFTLLESDIIDTKIYKYENIDIYFNEAF